MTINPSKLFKNILVKYNEDYHSHIRKDLLPFVIGTPKTILDIGCGRGLTGKYFKEYFKSEFVAGIEANKSAAIFAKENLDKVITIDLNKEVLELGEKKFDLVILGDIVEHLFDPLEILKKVYQHTTDTGQIIVSTPNVRNWRLLSNLIFCGDWKYTESGILDSTHLKFFTKKSLKRMIEEAGFKTTKYGSRLRLPEKMLNILTLTVFRDFFSSQHYISAIKN